MITGKELAQKVLAHVVEHPEQHDQLVWMDPRPGGFRRDNGYCGTTACLAGWAVAFNTKDGEGPYSALYRLAGQLDVEADWEDVGVALLSAEPVEYTEEKRVARYTGLQGQIKGAFYASQGEAIDRFADVFGLDIPEA